MLFFNANFICYYFYPTKKREEPKSPDSHPGPAAFPYLIYIPARDGAAFLSFFNALLSI